eukprot:gnl/MRDRNA2_/MRDRNA2_103832_c0_seq1.p1 gnl/MRDRNA2_/MRDRNA2_103832_c0~~gnl/MRDRNA2_/MRDRNA2_103832_c0_seq1.p1  ORF type:complete len:240 (+),score=42.10 gnl/MRDRNA2_/MRDRNA2_103832_c0_seq1:136-855(+)
MLFPMGGGIGTDGPPTEWALSMRKWVICLWLLLLGLFIAKLVVLDLFGALSMLIVVALGYFVPFGKPPMQQRWIIFWGLMCLFNAVIDLIFGIMHLVQYLNGHYSQTGVVTGGYGRHDDQYREKRQLTPMEEYMIKVALATVIIGLIVPFVEMVCAYVCYKLFKDHPRDYSDDYEDPYSYGGGYGGVGYGGGGGRYGHGGREAGAGGGVYSQGRRSGDGGGGSSFHPFQGSGQRLGGGR